MPLPQPMRRLILLVLMACVSNGFTANAQYASIKTFTSFNELGNQTIFRVFQQSHYGPLWLGTETGLIKFDGSRIQAIRNSQDYCKSGVLGIAETGKDSLLVSYYGQGIIQIINDSIVHRRTNAYQATFMKILVDNNEMIWALSNQLYVGSIDQLKTFAFPPLFEFLADFGNIKDIALIAPGTLLAATEEGVYQIKGEQVTRVLESRVDFLCTDQSQNVVYGARRGLIFKIAGSREYPLFDLNLEDKINDFTLDAEGRIWVSSVEKGLMVWDQKRVINVSELAGVQAVINKFHIDPTGNIWLGTMGQGLIQLSYYPNCTVMPYCTPKGGQGSMRTLWIDENEVLTGGLGGACWARDNDMYPLENALINATQMVNAFYKDPEGQLLILCSDRYIMRTHDGRFIESERFGGSSLAANKTGQLMVCSYKGVLYIPDAVTAPVKISLDKEKWRKNYCLVDADDNFWVATDSGSYKLTYDEEQHSFVPDQYVALNPVLPTNKVERIYQDSRKRIWFLTKKGVAAWYNGQFSTVLTTRDGLPDNYVYDAQEDAEGRLWLSTLNGICAVENGRVTHYLLPKLASYDLGLSDYTLWVSSSEGLIQVDLRELYPRIDQATLCIDEIMCNGNSKPITEPFQVGYENSLSVRYYLVNFNAKEEFTFEYQRLPQGNWEKASGSALELLNLQPGAYYLNIRARNTVTGYTTNMASVNFFVPEPWWMNTTVVVVLTTAILLLLFLLVWLRISVIKRRVRKEMDLNHRIVKLRQHTLDAVMNPHFLFNILNSYQYTLDKNPSLAKPYFKGLTELLRLTISSSKKETITLEEEWQRLNHYLSLERLRFQSRMAYSITMDESLKDDTDIELPNMVVQPFVENAIWHGILSRETGGRIWVHFKLEGNILIVTIRDNGIGFETSIQQKQVRKTHNHESRGIKFTKERLKIYNPAASVHIEEWHDRQAEGGTLVTLSIPIKDL